MSIIISKIVNCTKSNHRYWKQQTIKSSNHVFSESFKKMFFQIFNANWLEIAKKTKFDAKVTTIMIFQVNDFRCENHDHSDFSNHKIYRFRNFCYRATNEKILIISRNFDVKKKTHVKHSKFRSTESMIEFRQSWNMLIICRANIEFEKMLFAFFCTTTNNKSSDLQLKHVVRFIRIIQQTKRLYNREFARQLVLQLLI